MSEDDLEQRLAAMRPAELPLQLQARLIGAQPRSKVRWLFAAAPLAAAAVWMLVAMRPAATEPQPQPGDFRVFLPVAQESTLLSVEELGVIEPEPDQPIRLIRATWLDDITYRGDDGHSTLRRQEPRAEIVPIALQTF